MKEKYYIIAKDQVTGKLFITVTDNEKSANEMRNSLHAEYHDVVILTAWELSCITKPGWCKLRETIEIPEFLEISEVEESRDNTPIGTL